MKSVYVAFIVEVVTCGAGVPTVIWKWMVEDRSGARVREDLQAPDVTARMARADGEAVGASRVDPLTVSITMHAGITVVVTEIKGMEEEDG